MDPNYVISFAESTIDYLEKDKRSFESHLDDPAGRLGFAMIATAMAAFDLFAWTLFQSFNLRKDNKALFNQLINDRRFYDKIKYRNEKFFYNNIRCGVIHQLYPKGVGIQASRGNEIVGSTPEGKILINSFALYCDILEGCKKILEYLKRCSDEKKADYSLMLLIRQKIDENELEDAIPDAYAVPAVSPDASTQPVSGN